MAWTIEFADTALRQLEKFDKSIARRIRRFLQERIVPTENPRSIGEALHGDRLGEFWKYRVGDYRLIARIEDARLVILVVRLGHRREIYR
ncbi:MAG: type II toxin-antitoxin system RelE/ParE family toxin [Candidatus Korobacteraceae bacterium]